MRFHALLTFVNFATASLLLITPRSPIPAQSLTIRQATCPVARCAATNGDSICMGVTDFCCQLATGSNPYVCPATHPFCCPADTTTGNLLCGTETTCSGPVENNDKNSASERTVMGREAVLALGIAVAVAVL